jgi:MFS family permease
MQTESVAVAQETSETAEKTIMSILLAISFSHLLNDTIQSLIPAIYPMVKESFHLTFTQIGLITLTFQMTASLLQPLVGFYADRRPMPYALAAGMCFTLVGLVLLSTAGTYPLVLVSVALVGMGSSVFHPEASRLAYMAAGSGMDSPRRSFKWAANRQRAWAAVGGDCGRRTGPRRACCGFPPLPSRPLSSCGTWAIGMAKTPFRLKPRRRQRQSGAGRTGTRPVKVDGHCSGALMFSKFFYLASMGSYYTFYLIVKFHLSIRSAQLYLFVFLVSVAAGTLIGGPVGDRFRAQVCHLGLDSGGGPVHAYAAVCQFVLDGFIVGCHRHDLVLGVFGHPGLCAGITAGQGRFDRRIILRIGFWHGRAGVCLIGTPGRFDQPKVCLRSVLVSALARPFDRFFAESRSAWPKRNSSLAKESQVASLSRVDFASLFACLLP